MIIIGYTTQGEAHRRAAVSLLDELRGAHPKTPLRLEPLERKRDFVDAIGRAHQGRRGIDQLHLIGDSNVYGMTFGTPSFPEELSRHEWRSLRIPFAKGATAHFHAGRTARWMAPFFTRTFGVRTFGFEGETSRRVEGAMRLLRRMRPEPMRVFDPETTHANVDFDSVADLYDRAFADARARPREVAWIDRRLERLHLRGAQKARVLDLGCGNGALLRALAPRLGFGVGIDSSARLVDLARARSTATPFLHFEEGRGPTLGYPDGTFDVVITQRSFRFLDWDPVLAEIRRVLAPGGRLLVVEEVERPSGPLDVPGLAETALRDVVRPFQDPAHARCLATLERSTGWARIAEQNPLRTEVELRAYLESRFPGRRLETLAVSRRSRVVAFDSGPLDRRTIPPLARH